MGINNELIMHAFNIVLMHDQNSCIYRSRMQLNKRHNALSVSGVTPMHNFNPVPVL